jgi:hypothetical protein
MLAWESRPPWAYVAADRSKLDAHETIQDMGYQLEQIPIIYSYGAEHKSWRQLVEMFKLKEPRPEIAVIEAFQYLCPSLNRHSMVDEFMNTIDSYLQPSKDFPNGLTILGLTGGSKRSIRDRYPDPSMRVPGCATWVERAGTILLIEPAEGDHEFLDPDRNLYICRKHGGSRLKMTGGFTPQNRLVFPDL